MPPCACGSTMSLIAVPMLAKCEEIVVPEGKLGATSRAEMVTSKLSEASSPEPVTWSASATCSVIAVRTIELCGAPLSRRVAWSMLRPGIAGSSR